MTYYRVKPQYDNYPRYTWSKTGQRVSDHTILVANELYSPAEYRKLANNPEWFEEVSIPKNKTHFFFGARFEDGTGQNIRKELEV